MEVGESSGRLGGFHLPYSSKSKVRERMTFLILSDPRKQEMLSETLLGIETSKAKSPLRSTTSFKGYEVSET
jgi:hypothetical protein